MLDTPEIEEGKNEDKVRDPMSSLVGEVLSDRYRIEAELGVGGMGTVYLAEHTLMRKRLAIKVLHPEMTRLPEVVERFEREALAAAHIEHPNVAAATDFGKLDDGSFFLALEFVEGDSLRDVLQDGPMDTRRVIHVGKQIVAALVRAHGLGIVHRDLKPENVMLVEKDGDPDFVKVLDFGIAKVPVAEISKEAGKQYKTLTRAGMVYGTPEYMAPEQALGQDVDARADLYALGVILYEMLIGRRPFEADNPVALLGMQVTSPPPAFRDLAPNLSIPIEVETVIMELLEKEAARRPSDAKQVRDAFRYLEQLFEAEPLSLEQSGMVQAMPGIARAPFLSEQGLGSVERGPGHAPVPGPEAKPVAELAVRVSEELQKAKHAIRPSRIQRLAVELQRYIPEPLQPVPLAGWIGGAVALVAVMLVGSGLVIWWATTPSEAQTSFDDESWPPPAMTAVLKTVSASATPEELKKAEEAGVDALEGLFATYPNDPKVIQSLGDARLAGPAPIAAVEIYKKLFILDPSKKRDEALIDQLLTAASRAEAQDAVFDLLQSHMGSEGPDLLYDMAFGKRSVNQTLRSRATQSLRDDGTRENASPALLIALDLRFTGGCKGKHELMDRAREHGDGRTLSQLRSLRYTKGCRTGGLFKRKTDCWPCLRTDTKLSDAIKAVSARVSDEESEEEDEDEE